MRRLFTGQCLTYALLAFIACVGIFVVPFFFPHSGPVVSSSYVYGFNNKVSVLSALFSIGLFFLAALHWNRAPADSLPSTFGPGAEGQRRMIRPWVVWFGCLLLLVTIAYFYVHAHNLVNGQVPYFLLDLFSIGLFFLAALHWNPLPVDSLLSTFEPKAEGERERIRPWVVWFGCLLMLATSAYFYVHTRNLNYGEAGYFITRILFVLKGRSPYTDFEYLYGPTLLYPPVYLYRLFAPLGMSVKAAYYLYHGLASAAGVVLLAAAVNCLGIKGKYKTVIFALCSLIFWNEDMGLQYTLLRCVVPMDCLLLIHLGLAPKLTSVGTRRLPQQLLLALASVACTAVCLSISPEMGIAFFVALGIYWAYKLWTSGPDYLLTLLLHLASFSLALMPSCRDCFRPLFGFSGGGYNFPVVPAMNVLLFLFTVLYTVPAQLCLALTKRTKSQAAIAVGWAALTVALLPGALGRCDWGHTFLYGLPALIAACVYLLKQRRAWFMTFVTVVAVCFLSLKVSHFLLMYRRTALPDAILTVIHRFRPPASAPEDLDPLAPKDIGILPELRRSDLGRFGAVGVPLECSEEIFLYLQANDLYRPEYYDDGMSIYTPQQLARKLADLKGAKTILVPKRAMAVSRPEIGKMGSYYYGSKLFLFPFGLFAGKNLPFSPAYEIAEYIRANYKPIASVEDNYLMQARPGSDATD